MLLEMRTIVAAAPTPRIAFKRPPIRKARPQLFDGNEEPQLSDVMADPIVRRLLASDGISVDTLRGLVADISRRLDYRRMLS